MRHEIHREILLGEDIIIKKSQVELRCELVRNQIKTSYVQWHLSQRSYSGIILQEFFRLFLARLSLNYLDSSMILYIFINQQWFEEYQSIGLVVPNLHSIWNGLGLQSQISLGLRLNQLIVWFYLSSGLLFEILVQNQSPFIKTMLSIWTKRTQVKLLTLSFLFTECSEVCGGGS